jgi:hypothetical protein
VGQLFYQRFTEFCRGPFCFHRAAEPEEKVFFFPARLAYVCMIDFRLPEETE